MRAVDTNTLVRFLTKDDGKQAAEALGVIERGAVFVPRTVLLEVDWVLRSYYEYPPERVLMALRGIGGLPGVTIEDAGQVMRAIGWAEAGMDFADALHLAASANCQEFLTFDSRMRRIARGLGLENVSAP